MKREMSRFLHCFAWIGALVLLAAHAARTHADGLLEVEQAIFGMDCAPCAYGIERSLKKLPGAEQVRVSLNDGKASISFKPGAEVTLQDIRSRILDGGFTPKSAKVRAVGIVVVQEHEVFLMLRPGAALLLRLLPQSQDLHRRLRNIKSGTTVEAVGIVGENPGDPPDMIVSRLTQIEAAKDDG